MNNRVKVTYDVYSSQYSVRKRLQKLLKESDILSFDTETRSIYTKEEREEAKEYLKEVNTTDPYYKQARLVANTSGLSYPSIIKTTHFQFSKSKNHSHIFICNSNDLELYIWNTIADYSGKLIVHNAMFDLKICYQRIKKLPKNYVDTALMVKCLINHVDVWKSKIGLKDLMGEYYDPKWALLAEDYEPKNLKDENFIKYCAIDSAATYYLHDLVLKEFENSK